MAMTSLFSYNWLLFIFTPNSNAFMDDSLHIRISFRTALHIYAFMLLLYNFFTFFCFHHITPDRRVIAFEILSPELSVEANKNNGSLFHRFSYLFIPLNIKEGTLYLAFLKESG